MRFWNVFGLIFLLSSLAHGAGILNFGNGGEPRDIDPQRASGEPETRIIQNTFDSLIDKDTKTLEVIPGLAEKWTVNKEFTKYTFHLRKEAKFSNGEPITAEDVVYSWRRCLDPKTASETATLCHVLKNGKAYAEGKLADASSVGVRAKDAHTLEVELDHPAPYFLKMIYYNPFRIVHRKTIEKFNDRWTRVENVVVSGAFVPKTWETNKMIRLVKNPHYWDAAKVELEGVNVWAIENLATEDSMFRTGQLHITLSVPPDRLPFWKKDKSGSFQNPVSLGTYGFLINVTKAPLKDKRVRKALSLAIDRQQIVEKVTLAGQLPAVNWSPPGIGGYNGKPRIPKNAKVAEAKKLLAEAGYPEGANFPGFELLYNTAESHKKIAEVLQAMWKKNLGIKVTLVNQEWKVYLDSYHSQNYQIARFAWGADYPDASTFLEMFLSDNNNNDTGWKSVEYDKLLAAAGKETDLQKRNALFDKAEALLMDEMPVIPLYSYTKPYLLSPKVEGIHSNQEDAWPLKYVKLKS